MTSFTTAGCSIAWAGCISSSATSSRRSSDPPKRRGGGARIYDRTFRNAEITLGNVYLAKGDLVQAGELLDNAYRRWELPATTPWMQWRYSMRLFDTLGRLALARGDPARAREFADRCLEVATSTNSRKNLVKAWRLRGEAALVRRDLEEAQSALRQALPVAHGIDNPTQL